MMLLLPVRIKSRSGFSPENDGICASSVKHLTIFGHCTSAPGGWSNKGAVARSARPLCDLQWRRRSVLAAAPVLLLSRSSGFCRFAERCSMQQQQQQQDRSSSCIQPKRCFTAMEIGWRARQVVCSILQTARGAPLSTLHTTVPGDNGVRLVSRRSQSTLSVQL